MKEGQTCDVNGCENEAVKSVPREKAQKLFTLKGSSKNVHLCREHYKEYKKKTKKEREMDRIGWV